MIGVGEGVEKGKGTIGDRIEEEGEVGNFA